MADVERFMESVVAEMRARVRLLGDCGDRRAFEDAIALMTDYRLAGMDARAFERLLATLCSGRSPVGLSVLKPQAIGGELTRRWQAYAGQGAAVAAGV